MAGIGIKSKNQHFKISRFVGKRSSIVDPKKYFIRMKKRRKKDARIIF